MAEGQCVLLHVAGQRFDAVVPKKTQHCLSHECWLSVDTRQMSVKARKSSMPTERKVQERTCVSIDTLSKHLRGTWLQDLHCKSRSVPWSEHGPNTMHSELPLNERCKILPCTHNGTAKHRFSQKSNLFQCKTADAPQ